MQTLEYKNADRACFKTRKIANQSYQGAAFRVNQLNWIYFFFFKISLLFLQTLEFYVDFIPCDRPFKIGK